MKKHKIYFVLSFSFFLFVYFIFMESFARDMGAYHAKFTLEFWFEGLIISPIASFLFFPFYFVLYKVFNRQK